MRYKVMLEKTMLATIEVEAEDEGEAVNIANDIAMMHPENFEDNFDYLCLVEQWELHEDGNDIQIY